MCCGRSTAVVLSVFGNEQALCQVYKVQLFCSRVLRGQEAYTLDRFPVSQGGHTHTQTNLKCTPTGNLEFPIGLHTPKPTQTLRKLEDYMERPLCCTTSEKSDLRCFRRTSVYQTIQFCCKNLVFCFVFVSCLLCKADCGTFVDEKHFWYMCTVKAWQTQMKNLLPHLLTKQNCHDSQTPTDTLSHSLSSLVLWLPLCI